MVTSILEYIGKYLDNNIEFLDVVYAPAKRLSTGDVYINQGQEKTKVGISDQVGKAIYLRQLRPETANELPARTSCDKEYRISGPCRLIYYSFSNHDISEDKVKSILSTALNSVNFKNYQGSAKRIQVINNSYSTDFESIFQEETGKEYDGDEFPIIIMIDFTLIFEDKNCDSCDLNEESYIPDCLPKAKKTFCEKVSDCQVIKDIQEDIRELQENPSGGLTCEELESCEIIQEIQSDIQETSDKIDQEILDRQNEDTILQGNIDAENLARSLADSNLQSQIDDISNDLDNHISDIGNPHQTTLEQVRSENNQITGNIDANGNQIDNLSNPASNQQASTKIYTDTAEANAKAYADSLVVAVYRPAGDWDASVGTYPISGTGTGGAIRRGDTYRISVAGTIAGYNYDIGDSIYAIIALPGQLASNWGDFEHNTQQATESTRGTAQIIDAATAADENTLDDQKMVTGKKLWINFWQRVLSLAWTWSLKQTFTTAPRFNSTTASQYLKTDANKDLTSVSSIPATDVATDSTHRFVTDANLTTIGNQSGTNTGDETAARIAAINHGTAAKTTIVDADEITGQNSANSFSLIRITALNLYNYIKSKTDLVYQAILVSGTNIKTINGNSVLGSGNIVTGRPYFAYDNTTNTYSGSTAPTIVRTIPIPANSMGANSTLDLFMNFTKIGTNGIFSASLYMTTNSSAATGGTQIGTNGTGAATTLQFGKRFRLTNKNSQTSQLGQTSSNNAENFSSPINGAKQVLTIDFTVQQYLHILTTAASALDTVGITDYQAYIDNP